jgi:peptidoglycan-associated lipoprotein
MTTIRTVLAVSLLVPAVAVGCGDPPPKPAVAPVASPTSPTPVTNNLPKEEPTSPTASAVRISPEIAKACGIKEPDAYFAFDSAHIRPEDSKALDLVATCFSTGPLKGKTLKLVGHADPRGGSEYNMTLGQSRADGVAGYVVGKGLDKGKTSSTTRGEMDSSGTDEPSWAKDRRVDLLINP